jgi:hypothetical protein
MASRFRIYDNGGSSADRYTLIDSKAVDAGSVYGNIYNYAGFSADPSSAQGVGITGEMDERAYREHAMKSFRRLGKRVKNGSTLPQRAQDFAKRCMRDFGATDRQIQGLFPKMVAIDVETVSTTAPTLVPPPLLVIVSDEG